MTLYGNPWNQSRYQEQLVFVTPLYSKQSLFMLLDPCKLGLCDGMEALRIMQTRFHFFIDLSQNLQITIQIQILCCTSHLLWGVIYSIFWFENIRNISIKNRVMPLFLTDILLLIALSRDACVNFKFHNGDLSWTGA